MQAFLVRGTFRMAKDWSKFAKEVAAEDEAGAVEKLRSDLGSKHGTRRADIRIQDVTPVSLDQVQDPVVKFQAGGES